MTIPLEALRKIEKPSKEQSESGNYRMAHVSVHGLQIAIETAKGSRRRPEWPPMAAHYGYIKRTLGNDGDHVDIFVGPNTDSELVVIVDQVDQDGEFDEHKVLIGFVSTQDAVDTYKKCYTANWKVGPVTTMTIWQFKNWLKDGDQNKPVEKQVGRFSAESIAALVERFAANAATQPTLADRFAAEFAGMTVDQYAARKAKNSPGQMGLFGDGLGGDKPLRSAARQQKLEWITVKPNGPDGKGQPVLIDKKDGTIHGGMGGKFDGEKIGDVGKGDGKTARGEGKGGGSKKPDSPKHEQKKVDTEHLVSLMDGLSREKARLEKAKSPKEKELREVWVEQLKKEIANEKKLLGVDDTEVDHANEMSDDELLDSLLGDSAKPAPKAPSPGSTSAGPALGKITGSGEFQQARITFDGRDAGRINFGTTKDSNGRTIGNIDDVAIDEWARGNKMMPKLYPEIERRLKDQGAEEIRLNTVDDAVAEKVWKPLGFKFVGGKDTKVWRKELSGKKSSESDAPLPGSKPSGIQPAAPLKNEDAKSGDQLGMFGEATRAPKKQAEFKGSGGRQKNLIDGLNALPGQKSLIDEAGAPDDMVYNPEAKTTGWDRVKSQIADMQNLVLSHDGTDAANQKMALAASKVAASLKESGVADSVLKDIRSARGKKQKVEAYKRAADAWGLPEAWQAEMVAEEMTKNVSDRDRFMLSLADHFLEQYRTSTRPEKPAKTPSPGSKPKPKSDKPQVTTGTFGDKGRFITLEGGRVVFIESKESVAKKRKIRDDARAPFQPKSKVDQAIVEYVGNNKRAVENFRPFVEDAHKYLSNERAEINHAMREVLAQFGYTGNKASAFISNLRHKRDYTQIPGFDEMSEYAERHHPYLLSADHGESATTGDIKHSLLRRLRSGFPPPPAKHSPEVMELAGQMAGPARYWDDDDSDYLSDPLQQIDDVPFSAAPVSQTEQYSAFLDRVFAENLAAIMAR